MERAGCREQYPAWIVIVANLVPLLVYAIGVYILLQYGMIWVAGYLLLILVLEYRLIGGHCTDCYYYGKTCAFGKGRISPWFFAKGNPDRFSAMTVTWKDILPDFLLFIIPVLLGILLLVREFSVTVLVLVIALLLLGFCGNALVRGRLACSSCMQRVFGCPAEQFFDRQNKG